MAIYSIKLVDHRPRGVPAFDIQLLGNEVNSLFLQVFQGTSDTAVVTWGRSAPSDALVLHLVVRAADSYIQRLMHVRVDPSRAGNTYNDSSRTGSEFYLFVNGQSLIAPSRLLARIAFHEALHNVTRWEDFRLHGPQGGDGLASAQVDASTLLTPRNIELMRTGLQSPANQLL